ncbi:hypothetical protein KFL_001070010 [Klebsormidium nitens]|uniref:Uncharacterized protein n=1 Tax=Klebsormidium nitens TaxID=105231 RepID=A0A1Y1I0J9_KLENI|nr:hypothetical protein KFL_001070010 [Klebsormidium nitens]|eukprot:GAQ82296.1 hypothetical protein KFL_001070010 [Klebsormidium nitens]
MGKNQAHKAAQRAKGGGGGGGEEEGGFNDGMTDATFHSPEWHAARLAQLTDSTRMTWEEFKLKQKEDARKQAEAENDEERKMREYRAQLDAERAAKLARGTNHAPEKSDKKKIKTKDKDREKERKHKRSREKDKRRRKHESSSSASGSEVSDSDDRRDRKRRKKEKRRAKTSSGRQDNSPKGPVRLSEFLKGQDSDTD